MKEQLEEYVKRVKERHEHCRGNEQATKYSLIAPLFAILGYDMTDPVECRPEYKVDFGKGRSTKPIDWAFSLNGAFACFVEAKEVAARVKDHDEQLADYFAKEPDVKLGILTSGIQWRFFTDLNHENVMDREPFFSWDVLNDDLPLDLLTILQKSQFKPQLIRTFAERKHHQNLLVQELTRLLEPSSDFIRLAIQNIETRRVTESIVENWKPVLANALHEWAKHKALAFALQRPPAGNGEEGVSPKPPIAGVVKRGKVCPSCQTKVGTRTHQCPQCGYIFVKAEETSSDETPVSEQEPAVDPTEPALTPVPSPSPPSP